MLYLRRSLFALGLVGLVLVGGRGVKAATFDAALAVPVGKEYYNVEFDDFSVVGDRIDAYARIENAAGQIGFGTDGTTDIEHFVILNAVNVFTATEIAGIIARAVDALEKPASTNVVADTRGNTIYIFYPGLTSGNGSTDGYITTGVTDDVWANKKAEAGSSVQDSAATLVFTYDSDADSGDWDYLRRNFLSFPTATLPDGATINAATMVFGVSAFSDGCSLSTPVKLGLYDGNLADIDNIAVGDMLNFGTTLWSNEISVTDNSPLVFTLNATGLADISKTAATDYALLDSVYDLGSSTPNWVANCQSTFNMGSADGVSAAPELIIEVASEPETECGDGVVEGDEACDDGDTDNGDGCSSVCEVESGWQCLVGDPSVCSEIEPTPYCDTDVYGDRACAVFNIASVVVPWAALIGFFLIAFIL